MYISVKDNQVIGYSTNPIVEEGATCVQIKESDKKYIDMEYDVSIDNGEVLRSEGDRAIAKKDFELERSQSRILSSVSDLMQKKQALVALGEDTTEIDSQIESLQSEYSSIK